MDCLLGGEQACGRLSPPLRVIYARHHLNNQRRPNPNPADAPETPPSPPPVFEMASPHILGSIRFQQ